MLGLPAEEEEPVLPPVAGEEEVLPLLPGTGEEVVMLLLPAGLEAMMAPVSVEGEPGAGLDELMAAPSEAATNAAAAADGASTDEEYGLPPIASHRFDHRMPGQKSPSLTPPAASYLHPAAKPN